MNPDVTFTLQNFPGGVTSLSSTIGNGVDHCRHRAGLYGPSSDAGRRRVGRFLLFDGGRGPAGSEQRPELGNQPAFTLSQSASFDGIENQWTTGGANPPNGLGGTPVPLADLTPSGFDNYAGNGPLGPGYVNGYGASVLRNYLI